MMMALVVLTMQESLVRYRHAHLLTDGSVVWHSHPFGDAQHNPGGKTHQHTPGNQFAFDQLSQSMPVPSHETAVPKGHPHLRSHITTRKGGSLVYARRSAHHLRAPPEAFMALAA